MNNKRPVRNVLLVLVAVSFLSYCADYMLYVSPGNFYQLGELPVDLISISDDIAPVDLDIYTPTQPARYPLIVFHHGFGGSIKAYQTISEHLASHGFIVVLPQMYGPGFQDAPTAAEEATLGLDVLSWIEDNLNDYSPVHADTSLLGLAGHSRGGQVAYRITLQLPKQVKALAGVEPVDGLEIFGQSLVVTGPLTFNIPTYILGTGLGPVEVGGGGPVSSCAPAEVGYNHFFDNNPSPSWLIVATTHGHADMIDEDDFEQFCPGGLDRDGMRSLTAGTLAAFFSGILQKNRTALQVLSDVDTAPVTIEVKDK